MKKRKAKLAELKEALAEQKDKADSAHKSCVKYEKELKKLNREAEESLGKEMQRRKQVELSVKAAKRRIGELEFLLEDNGIQVGPNAEEAKDVKNEE